MSKRIDLIKMGKEALDNLQAPFKVRKDRKELESWIIDREQKIAELENKIQELKGSKDNFDVEKILNAIDDLALEQRRLQQGWANPKLKGVKKAKYSIGIELVDEEEVPTTHPGSMPPDYSFETGI